VQRERRLLGVVAVVVAEVALDWWVVAVPLAVWLVVAAVRVEGGERGRADYHRVSMHIRHEA
jgi:type IV secretory pathway TrbD component